MLLFKILSELFVYVQIEIIKRLPVTVTANTDSVRLLGVSLSTVCPYYRVCKRFEC